MAKRPTMMDVGERAGVSQATVSLVLNQVANARVAPATRARVLEAAAALGYRKGPHQPLAGVGTPVIGMLIDEVTTTPFATTFMDAAHEEAAQHDALVSTFCTRGDPELEAAAIAQLVQYQAVGVIYTRLVTAEIELPEALRRVPVVLLNCYERKSRHTSIVPSDIAGAYAATEALLKAGHQRIAHMAGEEWIDAARDREQGYRQALATWDIPVDPALIIRGAWTVHGGRELTAKLLGMPTPPTAIFCFNDRMAVGAYDALRLRSLRIPEDMSIVGFDDEDIASYTMPPLSTVLLPHDEMARLAVNTLLEAHVPSPAPRKIKIECPLVHRGSVAAPTAAAVPARMRAKATS